MRRIEPYSLRQTAEGNYVLGAIRSDSGEYRSYRVDRMQGATVTSQVFMPRYAVELTRQGRSMSRRLPRCRGCPGCHARAVRRQPGIKGRPTYIGARFVARHLTRKGWTAPSILTRIAWAIPVTGGTARTCGRNTRSNLSEFAKPFTAAPSGAQQDLQVVADDPGHFLRAQPSQISHCCHRDRNVRGTRVHARDTVLLESFVFRLNSTASLALRKIPQPYQLDNLQALQ